MGMFDLYRCPNTECWWNEYSSKEGDCPECKTPLKKMGARESGSLINAKKALLKNPETKKRAEENKRLNQLLFHTETPDEDLIKSIESDMSNLAMHEAGTKWMRAGTLLTFNPTQQMIGAGFKALMDQNKILIKQNELILRELKKLNE